MTPKFCEAEIRGLFDGTGLEPTFAYNDPWLTVSVGGASRQLRARQDGEDLARYLRYALGHCDRLLSEALGIGPGGTLGMLPVPAGNAIVADWIGRGVVLPTHEHDGLVVDGEPWPSEAAQRVNARLAELDREENEPDPWGLMAEGVQYVEPAADAEDPKASPSSRPAATDDSDESDSPTERSESGTTDSTDDPSRATSARDE